MINDDLVRRIRALGAIPTPFSTYVYYHGEKMREYGAERLELACSPSAVSSTPASASTQTSDYPPGPFEPMMALQSEVTRTDMQRHVWGPRQRITVEEAIRVGTLHGAYASFEEHLKGSIEPGKLADLVVLGRDPLREDPSTTDQDPGRADDGRGEMGLRVIKGGGPRMTRMARIGTDQAAARRRRQ